jgi:hypothetical protein
MTRRFLLVTLVAALGCGRARAPGAGVDTPRLDVDGFFANPARAAAVMESLRDTHCNDFASAQDATVCAEAAGLEGRVTEERAGWLRALERLRDDGARRDERLAWLAAHRLAELSTVSAPLSHAERMRVDSLARAPGSLGWRAALELRILRRDELHLEGEVARAAVGCLGEAALLGPIDREHAPDAARVAVGPMPTVLVHGRTIVERSTSASEGCELPAGNATAASPSFLRRSFRLAARRDVIIAVSRATKVFVDGAAVLDRSPGVWGSWNRFGARVRLGAGVHRISAEVVGSPAAIFVLDEDGLPAPVADASPDEMPSLALPEILTDPNPLETLVAASVPPSGQPLARFVAAELARADGLDDVAAFWLEGDADADRPAAWLRARGRAASGDPIDSDEERDRRATDLFQRLGKQCPRCVDPRLARVRSLRDGGQVVDAWKGVVALAEDAPERLDVLLEVADLAERLGWDGERKRAAEHLARRFPDAPAAIAARLATADALGPMDEVTVLERSVAARPRSKTTMDGRRVRTRDWGALVSNAAATTFESIDLLRMAGLHARFREEASALLTREPHALLRLTLAEEAVARGDEGALGRAVEEAARRGAPRERLAQAAAVVEGIGPLAAYRIDGARVLADFERADKGAFETTGPSSRILDYAVLWVDEHGSASMLEHEMVRVQSREAIQQEAEQPFPAGRILRVAVRKPDGRVLEPDVVQGKATLTMPELELGDVVEVEHVQELGAGRDDAFQSPRWFFREPDKSYWRSEYVVVTDGSRALSFDERGTVPPRRTRSLPGGRVETRWRVDGAPAVRDEPAAPPRADWLPSVQVSYGVSETDELRRMVKRLETRDAIDPRLRALAESIVAGVPRDRVRERVRRLHAYCLERIEDGAEASGPRVLRGGSGQRGAAFMHLAHILGIPVETALVRTKTGASWSSETGRLEAWGGALMRVEAEGVPVWFTVSERHAPFDWLPEVLRGQDAVRLVPGLPHETVPEALVRDSFLVTGDVDLDDDGTARVSLELRFRDRPAMAFRGVRARTEESDWRRFLEQGLLAASFPSWHTESLETEGINDREGELVVRVRGTAPFWLDGRGSRRCPFTINLRPYVALESRQTPLILETPTGVHVVLRVRGAGHARPKGPGGPRAVSMPGATFRVDDRLEGETLVIDRTSAVSPQRITPDAYPAWASTLREGLALVEREFAVALPSRH